MAATAVSPPLWCPPPHRRDILQAAHILCSKLMSLKLDLIIVINIYLTILSWRIDELWGLCSIYFYIGIHRHCTRQSGIQYVQLRSQQSWRPPSSHGPHGAPVPALRHKTISQHTARQVCAFKTRINYHY